MRIALALMLPAALAACSFGGARQEAQALAERYFAAAASGNEDAVLALYSPEFFAATPRPQFRALLEDVHTRCGVPRSHELTRWNTVANFNEGSTHVTLRYDVKYERCQVMETISVAKSRGGSARILGHTLSVEDAAADKPGTTTV